MGVLLPKVMHIPPPHRGDGNDARGYLHDFSYYPLRER